MRRYKLYKIALMLCAAVVAVVILVSNSYVSQNTFDISHMRYSGLDINRFTNRLTHLWNACQTINKSTVGYPKTLLYSKGLNTLYCPVPFAYSTWFKHTMLKIESVPLALKQLYNISEVHAVHSQAQTLNIKHSMLVKPERLAQGPQHILIIVRDPWQRLIAAYNDIVVRQRGYTTQCSKFTDSFSRELKFEGFLLCLLHYANGGHSLHKLDMKLSPIYTLCSVCRIPYAYIVRYESLGADLYDYITNIKSDCRGKFLELYHQSTLPASFPLQVVNSYINSVNKDIILRIQQLYSFDFKLFAYPQK